MDIRGSLRIAVLDRPNGADSPMLETLELSANVQRLLPDEIGQLDPHTEVILIRGGFWTDLQTLLELAPELRWIHVNMAGMDHLDLSVLQGAGVTITNSQGVLDRAIADFVLGAVLLWSKGLYRSVQNTIEGKWLPKDLVSNESLRALVLGAGGIGTECAKVLLSAGIRSVSGFRRDATRLDPIFDESIGADSLPERIGDFDIIVCSLPASPSTQGMVNEHVIHNLAPAGVFINVGRGEPVDHSALAAALSDRPDFLAVLDVTAPEPLPAQHPLLCCQNVVISPHIAGETAERHDNFTRLFIDNLYRYMNDLELMNRVELA